MHFERPDGKRQRGYNLLGAAPRVYRLGSWGPSRAYRWILDGFLVIVDATGEVLAGPLLRETRGS